MYGTVLRTKPIGSADSGQATALKTRGTANAATRARHCRFSRGSSSRTPSSGLSTSVRPMAAPASHSWFFLPSSSQVKNSTSASRMQPLTLVKTSVLVTDSVQYMASRRAGNATDVNENLNSRTRRQAAMMIAIELMATNQNRDANSGRNPNGDSSRVPPGGYR